MHCLDKVRFLLVGASVEPYDIAVIWESARKTPKEYFSPTEAFWKSEMFYLSTSKSVTEWNTLFFELTYVAVESIITQVRESSVL